MATILQVNSSGRRQGSASRQLTAALVGKLVAEHPGAKVIERDAVTNAEFLDEEWVIANFTQAQERSTRQKERLQHSQKLVDEVQAADFIVIGTPIYNFSISGVLKAWIDQICRPGLTFRAEPEGFVGLLKGKRVFLVVTSGGTEINGPVDYATAYMTHILGFLGITDVTVIGADTMVSDPEGALDRAMRQIRDAA
ncbi:FMN-dependent NADH-azoreductase [Denitrobaculum tricleocarpae]|nr:NAD(P)H-dependent oxidoreductase [Denitrobaculum tricleocarpae]